MAAKSVLDNTSELLKFVSEGFMFNLRVLPDTLLAGLFIFAFLFQSIPFISLTSSLLGFRIFHSIIAGFIANVIPGLKQSSDIVNRCSGKFPGLSYERIFSGENSLTGVSFPSYYVGFFSFLAAWVFGLPKMYEEEMKADSRLSPNIYVGIGLMVLLLLIVVIYRFSSGCDSPLSILAGLALGGVLGMAALMGLSYQSDRDWTNILGLPLIREKAQDGKPIYVCQKQGLD
jgi:xanthine/uracil permease